MSLKCSEPSAIQIGPSVNVNPVAICSTLGVLVDQLAQLLGLHRDRHRRSFARRDSDPATNVTACRALSARRGCAPATRAARRRAVRRAGRASRRGSRRAVSAGLSAPMSRPAGPAEPASCASGHARLEQPLAALRLRAPAAERADVERVGRAGPPRAPGCRTCRRASARRRRCRGRGAICSNACSGHSTTISSALGIRSAVAKQRARVDADRVPAERLAPRRRAPRRCRPRRPRRVAAAARTPRRIPSAPSCSSRPLRRISGASGASPPGSSPTTSPRSSQHEQLRARRRDRPRPP